MYFLLLLGQWLVLGLVGISVSVRPMLLQCRTWTSDYSHCSRVFFHFLGGDTWFGGIVMEGGSDTGKSEIEVI